MKVNTVHIVLAAAIALLLVITGCQPTNQTTMPTTTAVPIGEVGSSAPGFSLRNLEGETVSLDDYVGLPVVLNFWATWCGPCRNEVDLIQQIYQQSQDGGFAVLAVNDMESQAEVAEFMQEYNLSFTVLLDPDAGVFARYNIRYLPTTLFIDASGVIRHKKIGSFEDLDEIQGYLSAIMP
jgi:peroxiredoxin